MEIGRYSRIRDVIINQESEALAKIRRLALANRTQAARGSAQVIEKWRAQPFRIMGTSLSEFLPIFRNAGIQQESLLGQLRFNFAYSRL